MNESASPTKRFMPLFLIVSGTNYRSVYWNSEANTFTIDAAK